MNETLITAATDVELSVLLNQLQIETKGIKSLITGIGIEKAQKKINNYWADNKFNTMINAGICGSLNSDLTTGDIVIPEGVNRFNDSQEQRVIQINQMIQPKYKRGTLITVNKPVRSQKTKEKINNNFENSIAVDMEAYPLAEFCRDKQLNYFSVKIVSDNAVNVNKTDIKNNTENLMKKLASKLEKIIIRID